MHKNEAKWRKVKGRKKLRFPLFKKFNFITNQDKAALKSVSSIVSKSVPVFFRH